MASNALDAQWTHDRATDSVAPSPCPVHENPQFLKRRMRTCAYSVAVEAALGMDVVTWERASLGDRSQPVTGADVAAEAQRWAPR